MMHATSTCHRGLRYGFIPRREQGLLESIRIAWLMGSCHVLLCRHAALPALLEELYCSWITQSALSQSPLRSYAHTYGGEMKNTDQITFNHFNSLVFNSLKNEHCKKFKGHRGNFKENETGCTKYLCEMIICFELTDKILCFWRKLLDKIYIINGCEMYTKLLNDFYI